MSLLNTNLKPLPLLLMLSVGNPWLPLISSLLFEFSVVYSKLDKLSALTRPTKNVSVSRHASDAGPGFLGRRQPQGEGAPTSNGEVANQSIAQILQQIEKDICC